MTQGNARCNDEGEESVSSHTGVALTVRSNLVISIYCAPYSELALLFIMLLMCSSRQWSMKVH